jgi:hypothetical protein
VPCLFYRVQRCGVWTWSVMRLVQAAGDAGYFLAQALATKLAFVYEH